MKIYNSLTLKKEEFVPLTPNELKMYVCGITPYDTTHLGHAFLYMFIDAFNRYFRSIGYKVTYVQNVTDIDDDILKRSKQQDRDWIELGQFWTDKFVNDLKRLNILMPEHYVKATGSIPRIIEMVTKLVDEDKAYEYDGTVFFNTQSFPEYGKLSKFSETQMTLLSRERGANPDDPRKKNPLDFILWQKSAIGEPSWDSPWGKGRPGWHIECSAMINEFLGDQIDIHGGGRDLIYPHHESEIAQSECYTHKEPYVKYWMHAAMLMYQGEKMSKSLGNLIMVSDLLRTHSPNDVRWVLLAHHYRTPWEFFQPQLQEAATSLQLVNLAISFAKEGSPDKETLEKFKEYMEDDFQTDKVLEFLKEKSEQAITGKNSEIALAIKEIYGILGFTL